HPEGPYEDVLGKPLCGPNWNYIDPTVMIDDNGQAWLMFGNPTCYYVKLKEDMVTLDGEIKEFNMNFDAFGPCYKEGRTCAYGEGPWICKHGDLYYLVYAAFVGKDDGESMAYATGPSPTGPWTYRGQIQKGSNCFTIHGGIVDFKEHSYYFYHMNGLPGGGVFNRSAACEEFTFNPDGSIPEIASTKTGPKQLETVNPYERMEAEMMSWSEGIQTEKIKAGTLAIGFIQKGDYVKVSGVDFGEGADKFIASVASAGSGGMIEIHLDAKDGPVVGTAKVPVTGDWQEWTEVEGNVAGAKGIHDVYYVFNGGDSYLFNVDWWKFEGAGTLPTEPEMEVTPGDVNADDSVDVFDLGLAKYGVLKGFTDKAAEKAADFNKDGKADLLDLIGMTKFLHHSSTSPAPTEPPTDEPPQPAKAMSMEEFTAQCQAKMADHEPDEARAEQAGVQYGTVKSGTYFSTTCNREKPYNILLPANYDPAKKYPVLYCMHGYWENQDRMIIKGNGTMYTRQIIGNAIAAGEAKEMIVVFPYIYSSATQDGCSGMDAANNAAYDNFINDLTVDLMPHIEKTYSVKTGKDYTAITGFSMGGREALQIGLNLPDKFGYIGAMCPAPGVEDAYKGEFKFESGKEPYLVMITAGGNDQTVYDTPKPYHEKFEKNGVPHIWHYYMAGYHGDNSIHAHLYNFCRFVFQATD
ncbi:MAG: carbohydrate-binding protein, partial [Oscillospiraceae bacterium]|nr:carbohydrate-binding protein [Oscillospiraceae bacterium]